MKKKQIRPTAKLIKNNDGTVQLKTKIYLTKEQVSFVLSELNKEFGNNIKFEVKPFAI